MNFRDYDRKFWLVVEKDNKKIGDLHLPVRTNSFLCFSYYAQKGKYYIKPGLIFEAICGAVYIDGEYSITTQNLHNLTVNLFTKEQLNGFDIIPINNKAIHIAFDYFVKSINNEYYKD